MRPSSRWRGCRSRLPMLAAARPRGHNWRSPPAGDLPDRREPPPVRLPVARACAVPVAEPARQGLKIAVLRVLVGDTLGKNDASQHVLWGERPTAGPPDAPKERRMASNPVFDRIEKESRQGYAGFGRCGPQPSSHRRHGGHGRDVAAAAAGPLQPAGRRPGADPAADHRRRGHEDGGPVRHRRSSWRRSPGSSRRSSAWCSCSVASPRPWCSAWSSRSRRRSACR